MKQLLLYVTITMLWGIVLSGCQKSESQDKISSSESQIEIFSPPAAIKCSKKPAIPLKEKEIKSLFFDDRPLTDSAKLNVGEQIGYTFYSSSDSTLTYSTNSTNDRICIWVYAPDLELLNPENIQSTGEQQISLTKDGKYTIQVSGRQNSQEFTLEMSLDTPLTRSQAVKLIQDWLEAEKRVFGPPYDRKLAAKYLTEERLEDLTPTINWLAENKNYYRYGKQSAAPTDKFYYTSDIARIEVMVTENFQLYYKDGRKDPRETSNGPRMRRYRYYLQRVNNTWKIIIKERV